MTASIIKALTGNVIAQCLKRLQTFVPLLKAILVLMARAKSPWLEA